MLVSLAFAAAAAAAAAVAADVVVIVAAFVLAGLVSAVVFAFSCSCVRCRLHFSLSSFLRASAVASCFRLNAVVGFKVLPVLQQPVSSLLLFELPIRAMVNALAPSQLPLFFSTAQLLLVPLLA